MTKSQSEIFDLPAIDRLHAARAQRIRDLLVEAPMTDEASPPTGVMGLRYAISHHILEGAEAAGRAADRRAFTWYQGAASNWAADLYTATVVGPRIILAPGIEALRHSAISETPYFVLDPATRPADEYPTDLTLDAFAAAHEADFGNLLAGHAAVVCLLRGKPLGATLDSWTISRLPGTVFTDHVADPLVLARDLIHEAGHNWLNDAFTALHVKIDGDVSYFSPWKNTNRPAFGFIHACWAFPLTMIFTVEALTRAEGPAREFFRTYLRVQARLLAAASQDHDRALTLVPDVDLRDRLRTMYRAALALAS